ncbi:MAG: hypothetical protein HYS98_08970 [Deltaproteobacteria bacterium]|nr:hypothetical protein [Deltaproteobacteria bacterium]
MILYVFSYGLPLTYGYLIFSLLGIIGTLTLVSVESEIQERVKSSYRPMLFSVLQFAGGVGGASMTLISTGLADVWGVAYVLSASALFELSIGLLAFALLHLLPFISTSSLYKLEKIEIE